MLLLWVSVLLDIAILAGLVVRRRVGQIATLPVLLLATLASSVGVGICPTCNTWEFWKVKELLHVALLVILGFEVAQRGFTTPGAQRAARRWTTCTLVVMLVLTVAQRHALVVLDVLPLLSSIVAWLYSGLAVIMLWHVGGRIEPLHDAVLSGFPPYLMLYTATWTQAAESKYLADINPLVWVLALCALLRAAWQRRSPIAFATRSDAAEAYDVR